MTPETKLKAKVPPGSRIYAIGDVHGRLDLLDDLLGQIAQDTQGPQTPGRRVLVLLGDMIDRGPSSRGVLDRAEALLNGSALPGFEIHLLMGNHEQSVLKFMTGQDDGARWLANGGREMLQSYDLDADQPIDALRHALLSVLPPSHRRVLRTLEYLHYEGDYAFVHAGVRPGVAWENQNPDDLLWIRAEFTQSEFDFGACIVHGHSPVDVPEVKPNRIAIDTRAWASGVLTALVLEGETRRFLHT